MRLEWSFILMFFHWKLLYIIKKAWVSLQWFSKEQLLTLSIGALMCHCINLFEYFYIFWVFTKKSFALNQKHLFPKLFILFDFLSISICQLEVLFTAILVYTLFPISTVNFVAKNIARESLFDHRVIIIFISFCKCCYMFSREFQIVAPFFKNVSFDCEKIKNYLFRNLLFITFWWRVAS